MPEDIIYEIKKHLGVVSKSKTTEWRKELNLISWNGNIPKFDIRDWAPDHAELWYKLAVGIGDTAENLVTAAEGEHYEWTEMYAEMAKTAREEGFPEIAAQMEGVLAVEREHEIRSKGSKGTLLRKTWRS